MKAQILSGFFFLTGALAQAGVPVFDCVNVPDTDAFHIQVVRTTPFDGGQRSPYQLVFQTENFGNDGARKKLLQRERIPAVNSSLVDVLPTSEDVLRFHFDDGNGNLDSVTIEIEAPDTASGATLQGAYEYDFGMHRVQARLQCHALAAPTRH